MQNNEIKMKHKKNPELLYRTFYWMDFYIGIYQPIMPKKRIFVTEILIKINISGFELPVLMRVTGNPAEKSYSLLCMYLSSSLALFIFSDVINFSFPRDGTSVCPRRNERSTVVERSFLSIGTNNFLQLKN